jgi:hypothetical protein
MTEQNTAVQGIPPLQIETPALCDLLLAWHDARLDKSQGTDVSAQANAIFAHLTEQMRERDAQWAKQLAHAQMAANAEAKYADELKAKLDAVPKDWRETVARALRFMESGSHTHIARDTMADELRKLLAAPVQQAPSDADQALDRPWRTHGHGHYEYIETICDAYASGIGDGASGKPLDNPYGRDNPDQCAAYEIGHGVGTGHRASIASATPAGLASAILGLPCNPPEEWSGIQQTGYQIGHRDARHDAAELVTAQAATTMPCARVYPPDGTMPAYPVIHLGVGKVRMADSVYDERLPALWFGINEPGMPDEVPLNRDARDDESLAVVTFANVEGLDALLKAVQHIRREAFPCASPAGPAPQVI